MARKKEKHKEKKEAVPRVNEQGLLVDAEGNPMLSDQRGGAFRPEQSPPPPPPEKMREPGDTQQPKGFGELYQDEKGNIWQKGAASQKAGEKRMVAENRKRPPGWVDSDMSEQSFMGFRQRFVNEQLDGQDPLTRNPYKEAEDMGLQPGTPDYNLYVDKAKVDIQGQKAVLDMVKDEWDKRAARQEKLTSRLEKRAEKAEAKTEKQAAAEEKTMQRLYKIRDDLNKRQQEMSVDPLTDEPIELTPEQFYSDPEVQNHMEEIGRVRRKTNRLQPLTKKDPIALVILRIAGNNVAAAEKLAKKWGYDW